MTIGSALPSTFLAAVVQRGWRPEPDGGRACSVAAEDENVTVFERDLDRLI